MVWLVLAVVCALFLGYSNGANDNFKGVATLYGSKTVSYRGALIWTSITTFLGAITALFLAAELIIIFKGKGLVPDEVIKTSYFAPVVGLAAALTVIGATAIKMPVSTTHALIGALVGAGWAAASSSTNWGTVAEKFFAPMIIGPLASLVLAAMLYPVFKWWRHRLKVEEETCLCIDKKVIATIPSRVATPDGFMKLYQSELSIPAPQLGETAYCKASYSGTVGGVSARGILDILHFLSSGVVCFARGLNDTPKIAALLLIASVESVEVALAIVGIAMLIGGLIHSRRIAETMGEKITEMNPGQAFTANLVTGIMVLFASKIGLPVSTTHVSCGSIFGIGVATKQAHWDVIKKILLAWSVTLPIGFGLGALGFTLCMFL